VGGPQKETTVTDTGPIIGGVMTQEVARLERELARVTAERDAFRLEAALAKEGMKRLIGETNNAAKASLRDRERLRAACAQAQELCTCPKNNVCASCRVLRDALGAG